jgi:hypothetical protein
MATHSPGPWQAHKVLGHHEIVAADGTRVGRSFGWQDDDCAANGRLIAAAPELLATVKRLLGQVHADCLREGEEAAVEAAESLVASLDQP